MAVLSPKRKEDRLFIRKPFRHYRPRYSLAEFRWGLVALALLGGIAAWVVWRGANPDPKLFAAAPLELGKGGGSGIVVGGGGAGTAGIAGAAGTASNSGSAAASARGVLPKDLAARGWREARIAQYDGKNLYVKINGRAGYFKNFGFKRLYYASLMHGKGSTTSIDIELYDLGKPTNALGAYSGELGDAKPNAAAHGLWHRARNALYMTVGRYYLRAIGSAENATVTNKLERLRELFAANLEGAPLPWGYGFFVAEMNIALGKINYDAKNAFSFEFARDVYSATLPDDKTQVFIVALKSPDDALALAKKYVKGFASYGKKAGTHDGVTWVKDRFIGAYSSAFAMKRFIVGVRSAPTLASANAAMKRIRTALERIPESLGRRAQPADNDDKGDKDDGDHDGDAKPGSGSGSGSGGNHDNDDKGAAPPPVKEA
ncbi:MAG: hypothetical protein KC503_42250 [Myxococcales bacterium]|nr:hypothetical protein [Myxococcales bacterium]